MCGERAIATCVEGDHVFGDTTYLAMDEWMEAHVFGDTMCGVDDEEKLTLNRDRYYYPHNIFLK